MSDSDLYLNPFYKQ